MTRRFPERLTPLAIRLGLQPLFGDRQILGDRHRGEELYLRLEVVQHGLGDVANSVVFFVIGMHVEDNQKLIER